MPLHQFCGSGNAKRSSLSGSDFQTPPINTQEICDVNVHSPPKLVERSTSLTSTLSFSRDICRICHSEDEEDLPLIAPCYCSGSLRYVHQQCLQQWIKSSNTKACELCKFVYIMNSKIKPFSEWERLDLSCVERRKILCSVTFHVITITFVVFSLNVLIQRTSQEVQDGSLEWPFWTKVIVVAIAFTGSIVFVYVQCKMYIQLCRRWRAFNRVIYVQNAPEKMPLGQQKGNGNLYTDSLGMNFKGDDNQGILEDSGKRSPNISYVSDSLPIQDAKSAVLSSRSNLSSSKSSLEVMFLQGCPPGTVDWRDDVTVSTTLAQSLDNSCDFINEKDLEYQGSLSKSQLILEDCAKICSKGSPPNKDVEKNFDSSSYPLSITSLTNGVNAETLFLHHPNTHLDIDSALPDLSDVEILHLESR